MFESIKDRFGVGRSRSDGYDDDYGYDDQDYQDDDYDDTRDPDDEPSQGYDRYAPVTTRSAGTHRSYDTPYTDRAENDLGQRRYSATHPALVSRHDIRHSTSHIMGQGDIPQRYGRESAGRASDYAASGSETDYHVDTPPDQVADDIDAEEQRREERSSVSRIASIATGRTRRASSRDNDSSRARRASSRARYDQSAYESSDDYGSQGASRQTASEHHEYASPSSAVGVAQRERGTYRQDYHAVSSSRPSERSRHMGSFINKAARDIVVVAPQRYDEVERVSKALQEGNAVVLRLNSTKHSLAKRVLDFSFGVASALDGRVDCIADRVFVITRGSTLTDGEREKLKAQGIIQ